MHNDWRPGTPPEIKASHDQAVVVWVDAAFNSADRSLAEFARRRDFDGDDATLAGMIRFQILADHRRVEDFPRHDPEWWDDEDITSWSDSRLPPGTKEAHETLMDRIANAGSMDEADDEISDAEWDARLLGAADRHGLTVDWEWLRLPGRPAV
jgi:hypothetical protein